MKTTTTIGYEAGVEEEEQQKQQKRRCGGAISQWHVLQYKALSFFLSSSSSFAFILASFISYGVCVELLFVCTPQRASAKVTLIHKRATEEKEEEKNTRR